MFCIKNQGEGLSPLSSVLLDRATRTLAGTSVRARALTAHRQAATVTHAAIRAQIDQALDADADFAAQITLDRELCHFVAKFFDFGLGQRLDLGRRVDASGKTKLLRPRAADAKNALQTDTDMLLYRQIDTCNARHALFSR